MQIVYNLDRKTFNRLFPDYIIQGAVYLDGCRSDLDFIKSTLGNEMDLEEFSYIMQGLTSDVIEVTLKVQVE